MSTPLDRVDVNLLLSAMKTVGMDPVILCPGLRSVDYKPPTKL
jgi:hypothetical protein